MLQDIRKSVGFSPLDDAALQSKNKKPDVPMGEPVARACEVVTKADLPSDVSHIRDAVKAHAHPSQEWHGAARHDGTRVARVLTRERTSRTTNQRETN